MNGPMTMIRTKVSAGMRTSWQTIPAIIDFGFFTISTNVAGLMPKATPNITNAKTKLRRVDPPAIVTSRASNVLITSSVIFYRF